MAEETRTRRDELIQKSEKLKIEALKLQRTLSKTTDYGDLAEISADLSDVYASIAKINLSLQEAG